jgi:hypothetical protein
MGPRTEAGPLSRTLSSETSSAPVCQSAWNTHIAEIREDGVKVRCCHRGGAVEAAACVVEKVGY